MKFGIEVQKAKYKNDGKWAVEFGLISELESDLIHSRHRSTLRQNHIDLTIENGLLEEDQTKLLDEFILRCLDI